VISRAMRAKGPQQGRRRHRARSLCAADRCFAADYDPHSRPADSQGTGAEAGVRGSPPRPATPSIIPLPLSALRDLPARPGMTLNTGGVGMGSYSMRPR
jgi:hypothetical protein